jgi:arylsulfatase A-like enzyme
MHASLDIPPYYWIENEQCVQPPTQIIDDHNSPGVTPIQGAFWRGGGIAPDFAHDKVLDTLLDRAVAFLRQQQGDTEEQPFFLYLPLTAPHTPWLPKPAYGGVSQAGHYGDFTAQVDALLGTVLQTLDELDLTQTTMVIFSSDNGPVWYPQDVVRYEHASAGPLRGMKIDLWEGAHRVPMVVRWPGTIPADSVCDQLVCFTDWMATLAAVLGVSLPAGAGEDSLNILPLLKGQTSNPPIRETLIIEGRMIRNGPWKLVRGNPNGGLARFAEPKVQPPAADVVLYNLADDLGETTNLAARHPEKVQQLQAILTAEQAK